MSDKIIITQPIDNGKPNAAVPQFLQSNSAIQIWSNRASEVLNVVVDFRSFCHRAMAEGRMTEDDLVFQFERLAAVGLAAWVDSLVADAVKADFERLSAQRQMPRRLPRRRWLGSAVGLIIITPGLVGKELVRMLRGAK